jgi:hypothetical protein
MNYCNPMLVPDRRPQRAGYSRSRLTATRVLPAARRWRGSGAWGLTVAAATVMVACVLWSTAAQSRPEQARQEQASQEQAPQENAGVANGTDQRPDRSTRFRAQEQTSVPRRFSRPPPSSYYRVPGTGPYDWQPYGRGPYDFFPYNGNFPASPAGQ